MSFFNREKPDEIKKKYQFIGWFMACPIYLGKANTHCPDVATRNWIPDWWFLANMAAFRVVQVVRVMMGFGEMEFPMLVTGSIA